MFKFVRKKAIIIAACLIIALIPMLIHAGIQGDSELQVSTDRNESAAVLDFEEAASWGLSFQKEGGRPVGNASAEYLEQFDSWFCGNEEEKVIYLTFDAGYENGHTAKILDVLKERQVPAAFFLVGNYIKRNPELTCRMLEEGHIVGNHTYNHPNMERLSQPADFRAELESLELLFKETTGSEMSKYYRPPQGVFSQANLEAAKEMGYKTIFWSVAYVDWYEDKQPSKEEAFSKLLPRTHPGAIVLLHSTSATNAEILGELLDKWSEMGYTFESLDSLS